MLSCTRRHRLQILSKRIFKNSHSCCRSLATSSNAEQSATNPVEYCKDLVRNHDYEGFLTSHFYPMDVRGGYFALKAFSVELAMVQEHVSNHTIGKMRMQFWRDAIKGINEGKPPRHPIALALHETSQRANLSAYHLKRIVDARDAELNTPTHLTGDSLIAHAESTSSTVLYLLLSLLSLPSSALSHAASHLGAAQTITTLIRALPFHAKNGRMIIPAEITAKHGVKQEDVFRYGPSAEGIEDAVFEFATLANDHLLTARDMLKEEGMGGKVPPRAMPVFMAGVPIGNFLGRLEKANFDAFTPGLQLKDWKLPWQMWRSYYKRHRRPNLLGHGRPHFIRYLCHQHNNPILLVAGLADEQPFVLAAAYVLLRFLHSLADPRPRAEVTTMERLCDEVIQLIFYELVDPGPLTLVSKRFHRFSQDPYVRAHYFLTHYGPTEAMFYALGRGKILTERVLDILLTSGAHLSRYLIQVSMHHYFFAQSHFVKTPWVRNIPLGVFTYFLKLAVDMYGDIPRGKGEDDGSLFNTFLKESRLTPTLKSVGWETIKEILETYNFIPFCNKDPLMSQFPLALAIEPRLLPYAVKNGFNMDSKYRDFVFRKMFERPTSTSETLPEEIAHNVRELCKLDPTMFVSRTVAAEVCMEAKVNIGGYSALKTLDKSGDLRFELATLVEDLIKTFIKTRSICWPTTIETLRYLYADFPSSDPTVRLVILITFFSATENLHCSPSAIHVKLEALNLIPLTRKDVLNILVNPFVDRYQVLLDYAQWGMGEKEHGAKGMTMKEFKELVGEIISRCLEVACKGKLLKKLQEGYPFVSDAILAAVLEKHQIDIEDLPAWEDREACGRFEARLCRDYTKYAFDGGDDMFKEGGEGETSGDRKEVVQSDESMEGDDEESDHGEADASMDLGSISQESLTTMIRHDEVAPVRARRRMQYLSGLWIDSSGKLPYPHDPLPVGRWIKTEFGPRSRITSIFMTHAVINDNANMLHNFFLCTGDTYRGSSFMRVPVTLKHFQMLARLGKTPNLFMYHEIEEGTEFYIDEEDYLQADKVEGKRKAVKAETASAPLCSSSRVKQESPSSSTSGVRRRKRPRRSATSVKSYAVPDSDDEAIADEEDIVTRPRPVESHVQKWITHLGELLKEEQRKFRDKKKKMEMLSEPGTKARVTKSDFFKSLSSNLRNLRRAEDEKRMSLYGPEILQDEFSDDDDDDDYRQKARTKKRKTTKSS
ncbi:hypothetical protein D9615_002846 [Tricholomella constricta]|uniref:Uncharacterized protein n=1 Tax=Tricholomella constricta TaxID=117010 RepID=A0A8H5HFZ2_9AGAR|nr:hypothetical protein D9615_002846 [Tricholomella constricta]